MKDFISNINWKELLFPVLADLRNINDETDSTRVSNNNLSLANNDVDYKKVIKLINENRSEEGTKHNTIIVE